MQDEAVNSCEACKTNRSQLGETRGILRNNHQPILHMHAIENIEAGGTRHLADLAILPAHLLPAQLHPNFVLASKRVEFYSSRMPSYCSSCDRSFGSLAALKSHLASSSSPHPFRCSTCAKVFGTKEALENHTSSDVHKRPVIRTKPVVNNNSARKPLLVQQQASAVNSTSVSVANHTTPGLPSETDDRWSVIPDSHHVAVLAALSVHSHDPKELLKNKYVLDQNFKSSRKCKRCGGEFLVPCLRPIS
jgi:hypothetical protein